MYQALYRKYRPKTFDDVVGQNVIIKTLTNSILKDRINHAYLFTGPRGTGKTSVAKIFAKIVNCKNLDAVTPCDNCISCKQTNLKQNVDIIEIDAASNNGVDEIREIREKVNLVPSFGKYKVYIIDEVHMLTTAAFNALLKTLEEPPTHIIFVLATTEPHKIPTTILSRCQRFDFKKIGIDDIKKRLTHICKNEKINIESDALELIAKLSDGGMRDSVSLLDQLTAYTQENINVQDVHDVYGTITNEEIFDFLIKLYKNNLVEIFDLIQKYNNTGKNLIKILEMIIDYLKNTLIYCNVSNYYKSDEEKQMFDDLCSIVDENKIYETIDILLDVIKNSKNNGNVKLLFELGIIKIVHEPLKNNIISREIISNTHILDDKKSIKEEINIAKAEIDEKTQKEIENLKKIRINNTLANFNKKELISFKKEIENIKELLMNPDYSSKTSLILDGELKAKGDKNLIFVYKTSNLEEYFNASLEEIEKIFYLTFKLDYKPIAVCSDEWEKIKNEFNKNMKEKNNIYKYIEEKEKIKIQEKKMEEKNTNKIEEMFEDIIEYS